MDISLSLTLGPTLCVDVTVDLMHVVKSLNDMGHVKVNINSFIDPVTCTVTSVNFF